MHNFIFQLTVNKKSQKIIVKGIEIVTFKQNESDYISLTDMAKFKSYDSGVVIANWLSTKYTIQFMGAWEQVHNLILILLNSIRLKMNLDPMGSSFLHHFGLNKQERLVLSLSLVGTGERMPIKILPLNLQLGYHQNLNCI